MKTHFNFRKPKVSRKSQLEALVDLSLAAPYVIDPEKLYDALELLDRFNWNSEKAAQYMRSVTALDFDDAVRAKGESLSGEGQGSPVPGPA